MKPASTTAVEQAVSVLLQSIQTESQRTAGAGLPQRHPTEDLRSKLDDHIHALTLTLDAVTRVLTQHMAPLRRERNALSILHRLPTELLINILLEVLRDPDSGLWFRSLRKLSSVSHGLKRIIDNTPSLWSVIEISSTAKNVSEALEKSRDHSLDVTLNWDMGWETTEQLLEVGAHLHRWASAQLRIQASNAEVVNMLESPAPILRKLELLVTGADRNGQDGIVSNLFSGCAPKLEHIQLQLVAPSDWSSPIFSGLRLLEIHAPPGPPPSPHQLLRIIESSPLLEKLNLMVVGAGAGLSDLGGLPAVRLPNLRKLLLFELPPRLAEFLLKSMDAPRCGRIRVTAQHESTAEPPSFTLGDGLARFAPAVKEFLSSTSGLGIHLGSNTFLVQEDTGGGPRGPAFYISINGLRPLQPLKWTLRVFQEVVAAQPLTISFTTNFNFAEEEEALSRLWDLARLDSVTEMSVSPQTANVDLLVERLTRPLESPAPQFPFPNLRKLHIVARLQTPSHVRGMVDARYGVGSSPGTASTPKLPSPFDSLQIDGLDYDTQEYLVGIVGKDHLVQQTAEDDEDEVVDEDDDDNSWD